MSAARAEFSQKGFRNASLRRIAARAGVTTGVLYGYYRSKDELFDALVAVAGAEFEVSLRKYIAAFEALDERTQHETMGQSDPETFSEMVDYIVSHKAEFRLILTAGGGTRWERYLDNLTSIENSATRRYFFRMTSAGMKITPVDELFSYSISRAMFACMFEIAIREMNREEAFAYARAVQNFFVSGWLTLMKNPAPEATPKKS
ncbi:TetR/AcrR family transcriptional regulator [Jonquetella sp. BV3C21]|uniref:TetR/AcrR family transcriptional regulator n=1 Tax=Jonquetella sp. BV3C21 TaxID=1111126 RepID=UPI0003AE75DE|nr:TetR/AcrR family transcriptional regulator [Jonquetella sp. BV3C21]ERL23985.1 transcriptional regulator, TetR family [Jonquetella sp. BV3C21]